MWDFNDLAKSEASIFETVRKLCLSREVCGHISTTQQASDQLFRNFRAPAHHNCIDGDHITLKKPISIVFHTILMFWSSCDVPPHLSVISFLSAQYTYLYVILMRYSPASQMVGCQLLRVLSHRIVWLIWLSSGTLSISRIASISIIIHYTTS